MSKDFVLKADAKEWVPPSIPTVLPSTSKVTPPNLNVSAAAFQPKFPAPQYPQSNLQYSPSFVAYPPYPDMNMAPPFYPQGGFQQPYMMPNWQMPSYQQYPNPNAHQGKYQKNKNNNSQGQQNAYRKNDVPASVPVEDPVIINFGDLDSSSPPPAPTVASVVETNNQIESSEGSHVETESQASTTNITPNNKKGDVGNHLEEATVVSTTEGKRDFVFSKLKGESDSGEDGWKRNASVTDKSSQKLDRHDGIIRYSKADLEALFVPNRKCPPELKLMYQELAGHQRLPFAENRGKSPQNWQNKPQSARGGGKQFNNPYAFDEPHPDEQKLFSAERLQSENIFGSGRPDKVVDTSSHEGIIAEAKYILNLMTVETFDKMSDRFMEVGLDSAELMKVGVNLIVCQAQMEENFSFMYADLCKKISDKWEASDSQGNSEALGKQFKALLLSRCQEEFEQDREAVMNAVRALGLPREEEEKQINILKKTYTGHIRFVGEIYLKDLIRPNRIIICIRELLVSVDDDGKPDQQKLACVCKLLQTVGKKLEAREEKKGRKTMDEYFTTITALADDKRLSSKIRFGFKDLIEMRSNNWTGRLVEVKAQKLSDLRKEEPTSQSSTPRSTQTSTPRSTQGTTPTWKQWTLWREGTSSRCARADARCEE